MALAPRPDLPTPVTRSVGQREKANQRAKNKDLATAKLTQRSGSTGSAKEVSQYPKVPFEDVEDVVQHLTDIAFKMSHTQVGSSGWQTTLLNVPLAYAHDVLEAHMASQQGMLYARIYFVPIEAFLPPDTEIDDAEQQSA